MLVKAYDALNMPELRDGAARIMTTNFPQSRYLKVGDVRPDVPWWRIWDPDW
jgi:outer membrane protein assembly factor BamD